MTRLVVGLAVLVIISGCDRRCENSFVSQVLSPSQQSRAVLFTRSCGATTDNSVHLAILPADSVTHTGNVLVISIRDRGDDNAAVRGGGVRYYWSGNAELRVAYPSNSEVYVRSERVGNVVVRFESN